MPLGLLAPPSFSTTVSGVTATFSLLPSDVLAPQTIVTNDGTIGIPASSMGGHVLVVAGDMITPTPSFLEIAFSAPLSTISLNLAGYNEAYSLSVYHGATLIGSTTMFGIGTIGSDPMAPSYEGVLSFSGDVFTRVVIGSQSVSTIPGAPTTIFQIDNIAVTALPEPTSIALVGAGVLLLAAGARRRRA